ncbi:MAG: hypothetical protein IT435_12330, partial [Phycisphaerales bacterium]|nr:hypothetical protein [Phycisphaerales bacterium]
GGGGGGGGLALGALGVLGVLGVLLWLLVTLLLLIWRGVLTRRGMRVFKGLEAKGLPEELPPLVGEMYHPFRVVECSEGSIHLARRTGTRVWIFRRLWVAILVVLGIAGGLVGVVMGFFGRSGSHGAHGVQFLLHFGVIAGALSQLVKRQAVQWMAERAGDDSRMSVETVRWIVKRELRDAGPGEVERMWAQQVGEVTHIQVAMWGDEGPIEVRLASLPGGALGRWRARRLVHHLSMILDLQMNAGDEAAEATDAQGASRGPG